MSDLLKLRLQEWQDIDVALYELAICLGLVPDVPNFGFYKGLFWTDNAILRMLDRIALALVEESVLEQRDEDRGFQYRWSPEFNLAKSASKPRSVAEFLNKNLGGARFDDVHLANAEFVNVNFSGSRFDDVALIGASIRNANCTGVTIESARYDGMRVDGILVTELLRVYRNANGGSV